jgi:hypothetical protein
MQGINSRDWRTHEAPEVEHVRKKTFRLTSVEAFQARPVVAKTRFYWIGPQVTAHYIHTTGQTPNGRMLRSGRI